MSGRRTSRRVSTVPIKKPKAEEFVAAEIFDFSKGFKSPKGVMTRARRSSVMLDKPPLPLKSNRRKSMMPVVEEKVEKTVSNRRKSMMPQTKSKPVSGIELKNFYQSPKTSSSAARKSAKPQTATTSRRSLSRNLEYAISPKKTIGPSTGISMSDAEILKSLDDIIVEGSPNTNKDTPTSKVVATKTPARSKSKKSPVKTPAASVKRATRQTPAVKSQKKSPVKDTPKGKGRSTKAAAKSAKKDKFSQMLDEVKEVEVRLENLGVVRPEDPNVIFSKLESLPASPQRVDLIVEEILGERTNRKRKADVQESQHQITPTKKRRIQSTPEAKSTKKEHVPKSAKKVAESKTPPKSAKKTPAPKSTKKTPAPKSTKKTPAPKSTKKTPAAKSTRKNLPVPVELATSEENAMTQIRVAMKKTPGLKRLQKATRTLVSTPVQVNPAKMLKKNLRSKVETALENKIAQKPDSSPYLLTNSDENSPKFEKISKAKDTQEIKAHITGTPAVTRRRKFGTAIQPSMLAAESPVPMSTRRMSSTPLRGKAVTEPAADSTPIRPPKSPAVSLPNSPPMSPPGEMVTGNLGKLCLIM